MAAKIRTIDGPTVKLMLRKLGKDPNLSVGCGYDIPDGFIGMDIRDHKHPYYVQHDIEEYPWPFPDDAFKIAAAGMVVEHINPAKLGVIKFMDELHRVLRKPSAKQTAGQLMLSHPLAGSPMADTDPGHMRSYTEQTWTYFDPCHPSGTYYVYKARPWKLIGCTFQAAGLVEMVMEPRIWDKSYGEAY